MTKTDFLQLMRFPDEWLSSGMYVDELFEVQVAGYEPGHESRGEHERNGAFHWWLRRNPSKSQLAKLLHLAAIEPDPGVRWDVRRYIERASAFDDELSCVSNQLFADQP